MGKDVHGGKREEIKTKNGKIDRVRENEISSETESKQ